MYRCDSPIIVLLCAHETRTRDEKTAEVHTRPSRVAGDRRRRRCRRSRHSRSRRDLQRRRLPSLRRPFAGRRRVRRLVRGFLPDPRGDDVVCARERSHRRRAPARTHPRPGTPVPRGGGVGTRARLAQGSSSRRRLRMRPRRLRRSNSIPSPIPLLVPVEIAIDPRGGAAGEPRRTLFLSRRRVPGRAGPGHRTSSIESSRGGSRSRAAGVVGIAERGDDGVGVGDVRRGRDAPGGVRG